MKQVLKIIESGFDTTENENGIDKNKLNRVARLLNNRLRKEGATSSKLSVNHVDISGFVQFGNKFIYISLPNIGRNQCGRILIRTAKDNKDFTGGSNNWLSLDKDFLNKTVKFSKHYTVN